MRWRVKPTIEGEVLKLIPASGRGMRALDLGSGQGLLANELLQRGYQVTASDLQPDRFEFSAIPFEKVDLNKDFPFENGIFDLITASEVYEHLENHVHFARECFRLLKPNGQLVLSVPNMLSLKSRIQFLLTGFHGGIGKPSTTMPFVPGDTHISPEPFYQSAAILAWNGFRLEQISSSYWKESSVIWLWLYPLVWLCTKMLLAKEKELSQRRENKRLLRFLLSMDSLLGRSCIMLYAKDSLQAWSEADT